MPFLHLCGLRVFAVTSLAREDWRPEARSHGLRLEARSHVRRPASLPPLRQRVVSGLAGADEIDLAGEVAEVALGGGGGNVEVGRKMSRDDYSQRQKTRDAEYERQYKAWIKSLPPNERRKLEAQGLAEPDLARHGNGSAKGDAADSPLMREGDDPALMAEAEPEIAATAASDAERIWDVVRRVVAEVISHDNARLTAECIALASGFSYEGSSMTDIAKRHGITRAAISKRCVELTEMLDLRPSRAMRSLTARKSYRSARIQSTRSHEPTPPPSQS